MSTDKKQLIKSLNTGKNLEGNLNSYIKEMQNNYCEQSLVHIAMKYITLYEQIRESSVLAAEKEEMLESLNVIFSLAYKDSSELLECVEQLDTFRAKVKCQVEVLASYSDQFLIYEYVMNRIEHKFLESDIDVDDTVFAQQLMQYIMGVEDNFVVNERVKEVIGQLPVRMARSHFYELLKNSITLYKDSDQASLDSYLYLIRTSAMLYTPKEYGTYFTKIKDIVEQFSTISYDTLEKEEFLNYQKQLVQTADEINETSDFLVSIQEIANSIYVYVLTKEAKERMEEKTVFACDNLLCVVQTLFAAGAKAEIADGVFENLQALEGVQEKLIVRAQKLEGALDLIGESYSEQLENYSLTEQFDNLKKASKLMSTSAFVELEETEMKVADEAYIKEKTAELIQDFTSLFENQSIRIVRAIIGNTLNKMPTFFKNAQEIMDYVSHSLSLCKDSAEKQGSVEVLQEIMKEF